MLMNYDKKITAHSVPSGSLIQFSPAILWCRSADDKPSNTKTDMKAQRYIYMCSQRVII